MLSCLRCGKNISLGASDCAVCGYSIAPPDFTPNPTETQVWSGVRAFAASSSAAFWIPFATIYAFWPYLLGLAMSFGVGWLVERLAAPKTLWNGLILLPFPVLSCAWFIPWLLQDKHYANAALAAAAGHAIAIALGFGVRARLKYERSVSAA